MRLSQSSIPQQLARSLADIAKDVGIPAIRRISLLAEANALDPLNSYILKEYAISLFKNGQTDSAFEKFELALKLKPNDSKVLKFYGNALKEAKQYKKASEIYRRELNLNPNNIIALTACADALVKSNNAEEALSFYQLALEIDKKNIKVLTSYANALIQSRQPNKAFVFFDRALDINSKDVVLLNSYAKALVENGELEQGVRLFEFALDVDPYNTTVLNSYAKALAENGKSEKAFCLFERSLTINNSSIKAITTLNSYAEALARDGKIEQACDKFEHSFKIDSRNVTTLNSYAKLLAKIGRQEEAFFYFDKALDIDPSDIVILTSYGEVLTNYQKFEVAFDIFERALAIEPNNTITLNCYGNALVSSGQIEKSLIHFKQALAIRANDVTTLTSYARALDNNNKAEDAFAHFERALEIEPNNKVILNIYARTLERNDQKEKALEILEKALSVEPNDVKILTNYAIVLTNLKEFNKAFSSFEKAHNIAPNDPVTASFYASALEVGGLYKKAILLLEKTLHCKLSDNSRIKIYLDLGQLCYRHEDKSRGDQYFELAIQLSPQVGRVQLEKARRLLSIEPYNEEAISTLREIEKDSPFYTEAQQLITLNLDLDGYHREFSPQMAEDTYKESFLYQAIYHKIQNEIGLLKLIAHERGNTDELRKIIENIELVATEIAHRRRLERSAVLEIPTDDYQRILQTVSKTAHEIVDYVNNELCVIGFDISDLLSRLPDDDPQIFHCNDLLEQIKFTQNALNDLKAINEGVQTKRELFQVEDLFRSWQARPKLQNASIRLNINNGNATFNGDQQKIKGFLSELVENSVRHNPGQANLQIAIWSNDIIGLPDKITGNPLRRKRRITNDQKYLHLTVTDNGIGVPQQKKEWIFLPLATTTKEEGGGLGLFIIKRIVTEMNGYIVETGDHGANFEIYIPYRDGETEIE